MAALLDRPNREDRLDPAVQVARHEVGAADEHLVVAAVAEVVDARVLEETSDDRRDVDCLADAGYAGTQTANAAYLQVDAHASLRGAVQGLDAGLIDQGVHLQGQIA